MQETTYLAVDDRAAIIGSIAGCSLLFATLLAAKLMWPAPAPHMKPASNCPALEESCQPKPKQSG